MLFISPPFGNYLTFLPYTIPIKGSYTVEPHDGLLRQIFNTLRYSTLYKGWINKIGLRNQGIDSGIKHYKPNNVLSLAFLNYQDLQYFKTVIPQNANIEINVSCPNAKVCFHDNMKDFVNDERKWCIVKLSPLSSDETIDKLYSLGFRQFHCCNTYPLAVGALSGPILIPLVEQKIKYIKTKYKDSEIIAGGGIQSIETLIHYKNLGAHHFSISSLCFNPVRFGWFYFNYLFIKPDIATKK